MKGIVIIGGSAEAHILARHLPDACVVLPGPERVARPWGDRVIRDRLSLDVLTDLGARAIVEAAHPCDCQTAFDAARVARQMDLPVLQLVRPVWRPTRQDRWMQLRRGREAATLIPEVARVLVATGRDLLPELQALRAMVLMRRIGGGSGPLPLRRGRFLHGEGPFTTEDEIRLLRKHRIDWLLVHNAGGMGGWPKLAAARRLGLPVAMLDRPRRPEGPRVTSVREALAWVRRTPHL